jgi:nitroreductase
VERAYYRNLKNGNLIKELQNLGLTWRKPFLENAPFLICIFGDHKQPYYKESLWLAIGWMLLAAAELGLGTLTYKPDDMLFLSKILGVSGDYTPELIMPIGYTSKRDPLQPRKEIDEVVEWI